MIRPSSRHPQAIKKPPYDFFVDRSTERKLLVNVCRGVYQLDQPVYFCRLSSYFENEVGSQDKCETLNLGANQWSKRSAVSIDQPYPIRRDL